MSQPRSVMIKNRARIEKEAALHLTIPNPDEQACCTGGWAKSRAADLSLSACCDGAFQTSRPSCASTHRRARPPAFQLIPNPQKSFIRVPLHDRRLAAAGRTRGFVHVYLALLAMSEPQPPAGRWAQWLCEWAPPCMRCLVSSSA